MISSNSLRVTHQKWGRKRVVTNLRISHRLWFWCDSYRPLKVLSGFTTNYMPEVHSVSRFPHSVVAESDKVAPDEGLLLLLLLLLLLVVVGDVPPLAKLDGRGVGLLLLGDVALLAARVPGQGARVEGEALLVVVGPGIVARSISRCPTAGRYALTRPDSRQAKFINNLTWLSY